MMIVGNVLQEGLGEAEKEEKANFPRLVQAFSIQISYVF